MELSNEFEVNAPIAEAWALLTDIEGIAPCIPGARLEEIVTDGEGHQEHHGTIELTVGPITAHYAGTVRYVSKDDDAYTAILSASGRDTQGQGTASAAITAALVPKSDDVTLVSIATELAVTGKVAQFGRGVLAEVSHTLIEQLADNLDATVFSSDSSTVVAADAEADRDGDRDGGSDVAGAPANEGASPRAVAAPVDAAPVAAASSGGPGLKRVLPLAGVVTLVVVVFGLRRRRRG